MADPNATHKAAQVAVVAGVEQAVSRAFGLVDVHDLKGTLPKLQAAMYAFVTRHRPASSQLAMTHYRAERAAAGITTPVELRPAAPLTRSSVDLTISGATKDMWGPVGTDTVTITQDKVSAEVERLILNAGRESMVGFTNQDRQARGWARVVRDGACYFCRMLATRPILAGTLYHTKGTAGANANKRFTGDGDFKFHNNCHCTVEPVFGPYEATAQARADARLWQDVTTGLSGQAAINAFRRALAEQQRTA